MFNTPILFLIFNRPDVTVKVFAEIRKQQPKYLYIAADGARADRAGEVEKCKQTRELVLDNIDWDCEVKTLFRDKNLGCGIAVSTAITWFFENVEQGIILEDDILPEQYFFSFCEEMLNKYKDNHAILSISGFNFGYNPGHIFASNYMNMWGWATWRREAHAVDYRLATWKTKNSFQKKYFMIKNLSRKLKFNQQWIDFWSIHFNTIATDKSIHTWDYQWLYYGFSSNKKTIFSNVNYVKNIGFGEDATHTTDENHFVNAVLSKNDFYSKDISLKFDLFFEEEFIKKIWLGRRFANNIFIPKHLIKVFVRKTLSLFKY